MLAARATLCRRIEEQLTLRSTREQLLSSVPVVVRLWSSPSSGAQQRIQHAMADAAGADAARCASRVP